MNFTAQAVGTTPAEWRHFAQICGADLLPVVARLDAPISKTSKLEKLDGKTPTKYNAAREVVGVAWSGHQATTRDIARWSAEPDYSIGIIGRHIGAIDIDIEDAEKAAEVREFIAMGCGDLPCRSRAGSGRLLLLFKHGEPVLKSIIKTADGAIEVLGNNQQFLVAGTHKSGARYEWRDGLPTNIPVLSKAELDMLIEHLGRKFGVPGGVSTGKAPIALQRARNAADVNDPFVDKLFDMGWVLHADADGKLHGACPNEGAHTGGEAGDTSSTYMPIGLGGRMQPGFSCLHAHCDHIHGWAFLRLMGLDDPAADFEAVELTEEQASRGAAAAIRNAQRPARVVLESDPERAARVERERSTRIGEDGDRIVMPTQRVMTGSEMLEEQVFIARGSLVASLANPRDCLSIEEYKKATAGSFASAVNAAGRQTKVPCAKMWLESKDRKTVRTITFAPGKPAVCESPEGDTALNLWRPRTSTPPTNWRELSAPFFEHVAYLVPVLAERERLLDWIAHLEQDPGTLPSTHYLMVAHQTGIGRNWMAYALARAFAGYTALGYDLGQALRSGFNGQISQKLLVVVDELHEGGPGGARSASAEKLKSMLTEKTRLVNPKGLQQHVEFNCARFLMFSNHASALPLADNDRRVIVIENPSTRRSAEDYTELYALLDNPDFGPALAEALSRRDISGFNSGAVAPSSAAKERTIRAGRSEIEQAVRDIAADWPSACITSSALTHEVNRALGGKTWNVQSACVAAGLVKYPGRVRISGTPSHVWVLREHREWMQAPVLDIRTEVERGQTDDEFA